MPLENLIRAVLDRDGKHGGEETVVALHCQQMREWGVRGGNIELRPIQDDAKNSRLKFFTKLWRHNQFQQRLNHVMDQFTCRGEILWYFQPDPENQGLYRIEFFVGGLNNPDPQYKVFYKPGGREIDRVIIRYSYEQDTPGTFMKQVRWVRLVITSEWIEQAEFSMKPQFDWQLNAGGFLPSPGFGYMGQGNVEGLQGVGSQRYANPFAPNLPCVIAKNNARQLGQQGSDDFYWIQSLIETHEGLVTKAHKNLRMFSNPILVTTRSAQEVMSNTQNWSNTWAAANRYVDTGFSPYSGSTNPADVPAWGMQRNAFGTWQANTSEGSLDTIFGNVGEGERFGFIQADAVTGDQNLWIRQIRELIHWILGGVDPLGMSSGATFGEVKTLFGRVQNTADQKAQALYGYTGLAKVFELILWKEEQLFKNWLFATLVSAYPKEFKGLRSPDQLSDELCQELWGLRAEGQIEIPENPVGQVPGGDREVVWRYTREVFQNTTREELDRSIAARNEREDGLSQEWVLRKQYPNLTDQEIRNAMSGFSPRVVQNAATGIQTMLQLYMQLAQIPDPQDKKGTPMAFTLGMPGLLRQAVLTLQKEISYGQPIYEPAEEPKPRSLADIIQSLGGTISSELPVSNRNITPSYGRELPNADILATMGLPTTDAAFRGFYRPSYEDSQLRGGVEGEGAGGYPAPGATVSTAADRTPQQLFGGTVPDPRGGGDRYPRATAGSVGSIDPQLAPIYAEQLLRLLAAAANSPPG